MSLIDGGSAKSTYPAILFRPLRGCDLRRCNAPNWAVTCDMVLPLAGLSLTDATFTEDRDANGQLAMAVQRPVTRRLLRRRDWTEGRPTTVEASGVVTWNGSPVAQAQVVFVADGGNHSASALSGDDGKFVLATFPPDTGAVPGNYKVMVIKADVPELQDENSAEVARAKPLIPTKYADPNKSGLAVEIPEAGKTDITLELAGDI